MEPHETALAGFGSTYLMVERDDEALLDEVVKRHDREAFAQLFARYQGPAFSLAYTLIGERAAAEDAVQAAMLKLWLSASHFERRGSVRGWILRIVANEGRQLIRKNRKERSRVNAPEFDAAAWRDSAAGQRAEQAEVLDALRGLLAELPSLERQLVVLYYGGGLSQDEISEALACPRSTVTFKIKSVLDSLRAKLAQAGFMAALGLQVEEGLHEAICSGHLPSHEWCSRVLQEVAQAGLPSAAALPRGAHAVSRRAAAASFTGPATLAAGIAAAAITSGVIWWTAGSKPPVASPPAPVPAASPQVIPAPAAPPATAVLSGRHWNFNSPEQADDFKAIAGSWRHDPAGGMEAPGLGCMVTSAECAILLDFALPPGPVVVRFNFRPLSPLTERPHHYVGWSPEKMGAVFDQGAQYLDKNASQWNWFQATYLLTDRMIAGNWAFCVARMGISGERKTFLNVMERSAGDRGVLRFYGRYLVDDLEIHAGSENEVRAILDTHPAKKYHDKSTPEIRAAVEEEDRTEMEVDACLKALERIPRERRVGTVELPELPAQNPAEPVRVLFGIPSPLNKPELKP